MSQLSAYVSVQQRYRRSVNITSDSRDVNSLTGFLVTSVVTLALDRILTNIENKQGTRSFMLFGPYGAGKSTFAVFLCALFSAKDNQASTALQKVKANHFTRFSALASHSKPYVCVPITARRRPIGLVIMEELLETVQNLPFIKSRAKLVKEIQDYIESEAWRDSSIILGAIKNTQKFVREHGYHGLVLIIDEAGKSLEYAIQDRDGGDVYIFQQIAEYANGLADASLLFITIQHQYFTSYAELSNATIRCEWEKVQERFETIKFDAPLSASIRTLGSVFDHPKPRPEAVQHAVTRAVLALNAAGLTLPHGLQESEFRQLCLLAWPLHPTVVLTLPVLFKRLAQNERSLFSYLTSQEHHAFQEHCVRTIDTDYGFVRLSDIAHYIVTNMAVTLARRPEARAMLQAVENIETDAKLTESQQRLLYTISILNVIGNLSPVKATEAMLTLAHAPVDKVKDDLAVLRQRSVLTFRHADASYRLWEGGEVDLAARMEEARSTLRVKGASFIDLVREHVVTRPFVARRHSHETGAHRYFEVQYTHDIPELLVSQNSTPAKASASAKFKANSAGNVAAISSCLAGQVYVLLPTEGSTDLVSMAIEASRKNKRLVFALPQQLDMLRYHAEELACLRWVRDNTPEMRDDRMAQKEFALQLSDCERHVRQNTMLLLDPRPAPYGNACQWIWNGEVATTARPVDVTRLLSKVCDTIYKQGVCINNELIARPVLSGAATGARTTLLKAMLLKQHEQNLGIEKFPPERSMYASVLLNTGLHKQDEAGQWHLCPPDEGSKLYPVWKGMQQAIFGADGEQVPVLNVYATLTAPPYGVAEGLLPVLLLMFYLCNKAELFLYREGSFLSSLTEGDIELFQRRPDLFDVSGVTLDGERRALVERYALGLGVEPTVPAVVARLFAALQSLPPFTQQTSKLNAQRGKALRDKFKAARRPEQLLFKDLPKAFGMKPMLSASKEDAETTADAFAEAMRESMMELMNFVPRMQMRCRDVFLQGCGFSGDPSDWDYFMEQTSYLAKRLPKGELSPLLQRLCRKNETRDETMQAMVGLIAGKSIDRWADSDVVIFDKAAHRMGEQFRHAWDSAGAAFLTSDELKEKQKVFKMLMKHTVKAAEGTSARVMAEALRELLHHMEEKARGQGV